MRPVRPGRRRQTLGFVIVGCAGYAIDTGCTVGLIAAGLPPLIARIPALAVAIFATWVMNGAYTFADRAVLDSRSLARYVGIAACVAAGNYAIYGALVLAGIGPVAAIAIASVIGMCASFVGYRNFAFRSGRAP